MRASSRGFRRALGIYSAVLCAAVLIGLGVLWVYLADFERSQPERAVEQFVATRAADFWSVSAGETVNLSRSPFDLPGLGADAYGLADGEISWRPGVGTESEKSYILLRGGKTAGELRLVPGKPLRFGLTSWKAADYTPTASRGWTMKLLLPVGARGYINGVEIGGEYQTGSETLPVELLYSFDRAPEGVCYTVPGLHGEAVPSAIGADGEALIPTEDGAGRVIFTPTAAYGFELIAPAEAEFKVNGAPADLNCSDLGAELGGSAGELLKWSCDGLYSEPSVTVTQDGAELTPVELRCSVCYTPGASEEPPRKVSKFVRDYLGRYISFTANLGDDAAGNFSQLNKYLAQGSDYASRLLQTIEPISWLRGASVSNLSVDIYDYIPMPDGGFYCRASYSLTNRTGYETREVSAECEILALNGGQYGYSVTGMNITAQE